MKTALYKTDIFVPEVYKLYVCLSLSSVSYTHNMYEYLPFIISETNITIIFPILNVSISLYVQCETGKLIFWFIFCCKTVLWGKEGGYTFLFLFLN